MVIVVMVHSHLTFLVYEVDLLFQELKYCGDLFFSVIFRDHILLNFYTCDRTLYYLYSSRIFAVVRIFTHNIIRQVKLPLFNPHSNHKLFLEVYH